MERGLKAIAFLYSRWEQGLITANEFDKKAKDYVFILRGTEEISDAVFKRLLGVISGMFYDIVAA